MRAYWLAPAALAGWILGCVSTQATRLNPQQVYPKICSQGVQLYTDSGKVGKPYVEVAVLTSAGSQSLTSQSDMYESMRKKAADVGANGVILGQVQQASTGAQVANALIGTPADRRGQAIAIYIPSDTARVRESCAGGH